MVRFGLVWPNVVHIIIALYLSVEALLVSRMEHDVTSLSGICYCNLTTLFERSHNIWSNCVW